MDGREVRHGRQGWKAGEGRGERQGWEAGEIGMNDIIVSGMKVRRTGKEGMQDRTGRDGRQEDRGS
jgi:hypothetical protein